MIRQKPEPKKKKRVQAGPVVAGALKSFVERIERVEHEQKEVAGSKREIFDEAKSHGYDAKTIRWVVQERKLDAADRAERDTLREVYGHALSLAVSAVSNGDMSLRQAAAAHGVSKSSIHRALAVPEVSREMEAGDLGEWLPPHDPATGEVLEPAPDKPGAVLPCASAWHAVTAARDEWEAAAEAIREAKREQRRQENARASKLAKKSSSSFDEREHEHLPKPEDGDDGITESCGQPDGGSAEVGADETVAAPGPHDAKPVCAEIAHTENEAPATPSVGAVADDDLDIPAHLRGPSPANRRVA